MKEKKTVAEVLAFTVEQFRAANIRNAEIEEHGILGNSASLRVRRSFGIEGAISVRGTTYWPSETDAGELSLIPTVSVNFVGSQRDVVRAVAFMHLVNELTLLAASIQAMLDEFEVVVVTGEMEAATTP